MYVGIGGRDGACLSLCLSGRPQHQRTSCCGDPRVKRAGAGSQSMCSMQAAPLSRRREGAVVTEVAHSVEWQVRIAALAYAFFSASGNEACAKIIGKTVTPGQFTPLNGQDFVKYLEVADGQVSPIDNAPDIDRILRKRSMREFSEPCP